MPRRFSLLLYIIIFASACLQAQVATVLTDVTQVDFQSARNCTTHHKTVVQVNNERGLEYARFAVGCEESTSLAAFSGEISYGKGGKQQKIKKSHLTRSEYSSMLATDAYSYVYVPQPASYPFTVSYEWTMRSTDAVLCLDVFCPQPGFDVDVKHSSYSIVHAPDVKIHYALRNVKDEVREITYSDGRPGLLLEQNDLPAVKYERNAPPFDQIFPHAYFVPSTFTFSRTSGSLSSWQEFGKWLDELREGRDVLPDALKTKLHALTDTCSTPRQKLLLVYRLLEEQTRYVSMQLGIGGMQPASAAEVCKYGFGDCKGLSNLMVAMLHEVGIAADYVVIGTKHADLSFPTPGETAEAAAFANVALLDHAIARAHLPEGDVWIECTNPQLPLGYVHSSIAGHEALVVSANPECPSEVVRLPQYSATENADCISIIVRLDKDGAAQMEVDERETNVMYEADKYLLDLAPDKQRSELRDQLLLSDFDFSYHAVEQICSTGPTEERLPELSVKFGGHCRKYGAVTGSRLFVPLLPYGSLSPLNGKAERTLPVQHGRQDYTRCYHLEFFLPEGYDVEHLPASLNETTEFGSICFAVTCDGANASRVSSQASHVSSESSYASSQPNCDAPKIIVDLRIERSPFIPADRYPDFCAFLDKLYDLYKAKIVLKERSADSTQ